MSYTDLRDFAEEYKTTTDSGLTVRLEKLGGGTIGKAYVGAWRYIVTDASGTEIGRGQDFQTGMPHTHERAARVLAGWFGPSRTNEDDDA